MRRESIAAICVVLALSLAASTASAQASRVLVAGEGALNGIFDPSLEFDGAGPQGWLSYSAVFGDVAPWGPHVETHLASTSDAGATFIFHSVVNASTFATITLPGGASQDGVWNAEVSSLVYDPDDPGAEWKLFAHRIFRKTEPNFTEEQNLPAYSWISLRTAPDPSGPWSPERALLASGIFPPAPFSVEIQVNDLDPSLTGLLVYSEPGAFYREGVVYLSLSGLTASGPDRIILLASDDHGLTWRYVGTPLGSADVQALGFLSADGSAIVEDRGRAFLLVTPESPGVLNDGTLVLEFADLASGALRRSGGVPVVRKHLAALPGLPANRRGGQADFHPASITGILQPALQLDDFPAFFQIFATGERPATGAALPALGRLGLPVLALLVLGGGRWAARRVVARR